MESSQNRGKKKKEQKKTYWDNYFSYLTDIILLYASYISYNMIESATLTKIQLIQWTSQSLLK